MAGGYSKAVGRAFALFRHRCPGDVEQYDAGPRMGGVDHLANCADRIRPEPKVIWRAERNVTRSLWKVVLCAAFDQFGCAGNYGSIGQYVYTQALVG
jgi:hypothetical protein